MDITAQTEKKRFGKIELGYAAGSIGHIPTTIISGFFLTFCTYILGMDAAWMAGLFLVGRIWDGINDPLIGSLPDRRKIGKSGDRFKPWMKVFLLPYVLSAVMCFIHVPFEPGSGLLYFWVAFAYIGSETCNTGVMMSYNAMVAVITDKPEERAKLARGKTVATVVTGIILGIVPPLVCFDENNILIPSRILILAVCGSLLSLGMYLLYFRWVPERIVYSPSREKYSLRLAIKNIVTNRNLIGMMVVAFGLAIAAGSSTIKVHMLTEYYRNTKAMSLGTVSTPLIIALIVLLPAFVRKFGTRRVIVWSLIANLAGRVLMLAVPFRNAVAFILIEALLSTMLIPLGTLNMVLTASAIDYGEHITGERNDGATFAIYTFAGKIGVAISSSFAAFGLSLVGYQSGTDVVQTESAVNGIRNLYFTIPVVGAALILFAMAFIYNLSDEKIEKIQEELRQRRAGGEAFGQID